MQNDLIHYMETALNLAEHGRNTVSPNPMVGCVIVNNNQIIGSGYHVRAGEAHAEIHALKEAGKKAKHASVFVTLEPCSHHGRTPPCIDALIASQVKKVYVACIDPNPKVSGKGIAALRDAGIEVEVGMLEEKAKQLNEIFFHYIQTKRPFVILKWAMSLDGKTVTQAGDDKQITDKKSQMHMHELRASVDAILVGSETAKKDNPQLTARLSSEELSDHQPLRIVLASRGDLPLDLNVFENQNTAKTVVVTTDNVDSSWQHVKQKNIEIITLQKNKKGQVDLNSLLNELGKREITSLLVEGGMTIHHDFFTENLANKIIVYVAGMIIGSLPAKNQVDILTCEKLDNDFCFTAKPFSTSSS